MKSSLWFDASMLALILVASVIVAAADKAAAPLKIARAANSAHTPAAQPAKVHPID
jgi:hypothetical protein